MHPCLRQCLQKSGDADGSTTARVEQAVGGTELDSDVFHSDDHEALSLCILNLQSVPSPTTHAGSPFELEFIPFNPPELQFAQ